jgi:hypothetical protein
VSSSKEAAKRISLTVLVGAAFGIVFSVMVSPGFIEWWAKPAVPTVCSCVEQIEWALSRMRQSLAVFAIVFAMVTVAIVEIYRRIRAKKPAAPVTQT